MDIHIINYGVGNIGSIINILLKIGYNPVIVNQAEKLQNAGHLILPGVGAFDNAIEKLESGGWIPNLNTHVQQGKPIMGICLGMQLMTESSEEGVKQGFGWIKGRTIRFRSKEMETPERIPHMGWNLVDAKKENILFEISESEKRFYFLHSYHVVCDNQHDILTTTHHGYTFTSSFQRDNIIGV